MAYRNGDRKREVLLPDSIEKYVTEEDPVRIYDAIIEQLDLESLGIDYNEKKVGNPAYNPVSMLKLLVYSYSYGWRSSRKIERALHHNLSFIWLMGGLKPDHKTIANFRKNNKSALVKVFREVTQICIKLDFIDGNVLFVDGSRFRGNSSINQTYTKKALKKKLKRLENDIKKLIEESEATDKEESNLPSLVKGSENLKELKSKNKLKDKIKAAMNEMEKEELKKINLTDNEAKNFSGRQGSHAGYNVQMVTDDENGLIVNVDVTNEANDKNLLTEQVQKANEQLERPCKTVCADSGYSSVKDLKKTMDAGIEVIVPSQEQASYSKEDKPFSKDNFIYNEKENCYYCPENKRLKYSYTDKNGYSHYTIEQSSICKGCIHYGICTDAKRGRKISRSKDERYHVALKKKYDSERGKEIYKRRRERVELPFGHMKRNLNGWLFLLRGIKGAGAEMAINATCFNIARMVTLAGGTPKLLKMLEI